MNILFINSISANKYGGGEKWMIMAANGLMENGHNVFIGSRRNSHILNKANEKGIKTKVLNTHTDISPVDTWIIARFLKQEKIDVLICNLNKDVRVAGLAARIVKYPVVIARHGVKLIGKKWKHKFTLTNLADGIVTNTQTIRNEYMQYNWFDENFIHIIYNGIKVQSSIKPYNFEKEYPGKKIVFSAGRLSEQKGFKYLIESADLILKKRKDIVFVVAGKGKLEDELKAMITSLGIQNNFHFIGFKDNISPYIKGCDVFVLSSLFEGMPNVVMEAMAVGKPVVATDVNGVRELMQDRRTGTIVAPKKSFEMALAIEELIDNPQLAADYGNQALEHVQMNFSVSRMVQKLEQYLKVKVNEKIQREEYKNTIKNNKATFNKIFGQTVWPLGTEEAF